MILTLITMLLVRTSALPIKRLTLSTCISHEYMILKLYNFLISLNVNFVNSNKERNLHDGICILQGVLQQVLLDAMSAIICEHWLKAVK